MAAPADGRERGAPEQIEAKNASDYLAVMSKAVFQTGMSWTVIEKKWQGIVEAMHGFDAGQVATMSDDEISRLMTDTRVIRNRAKLQAVRDNARQLLDLEDQYGSVAAYLRGQGDFEATARDLRKRFRFLGDMGAFHFLYVVKEPVPTYDEWCASRGREHGAPLARRR
jgi:3-methyladenine DNA glycosylase Tag